MNLNFRTVKEIILSHDLQVRLADDIFGDVEMFHIFRESTILTLWKPININCNEYQYYLYQTVQQRIVSSYRKWLEYIPFMSRIVNCIAIKDVGVVIVKDFNTIEEDIRERLKM
jgi:hypothetical protein